MSSSRHSILPPSGAAVWSQCPGSVTLAMQTSQPWSAAGESASEGRDAHAVAERYVLGDQMPSGDADMSAGARLWADTLERLRGGSGLWDLEQPVSIPDVHPLCGGTPDASRYDREAGILDVADYKYGRLTVEAWPNWQLIAYASGLLSELGIDGHADQHVRVRFTVVQPRASHPDGPVRTATVYASELRPYINKLAAAAERALSPGATVQDGPHCRYCPARYACPAARNAAGAAMDYEHAARPDWLSNEAMAYEYEVIERAIQALDYRKTGLEAQIMQTIQDGGHVPGYTIEPGQGRRAWTVPGEQVRRLGEYYGLPLTEEKPVTPTQAINLGVDKDVILSYSEIPKRAHKLVKVDTTKSAKAFRKQE